MANTIISPNRYVQGRGELKNLPEHAKKLGKKLFVIISASGLKRVRDLLEKSFENTGMELKPHDRHQTNIVCSVTWFYWQFSLSLSLIFSYIYFKL